MKEPECFIDEFGTKRWLVDDKLHRLDGPAVEWSDGLKSWWVDGKRHRLDGPAIEWTDGIKEWWVNHKQYQTQQEHALAAFLWMNEHERT
jgi:hypothetical protein